MALNKLARMLIQGPVETGSNGADVGPVIVGGLDGSSLVRPLLVGSDGSLTVTTSSSSPPTTRVEGTTASGSAYATIRPVLGGWGNQDTGFLNQWLGGSVTSDNLSYATSMPWVQGLIRLHRGSNAWDRWTTVGQASNTSGAGIGAIGLLCFDGANYQVQRTSDGGNGTTGAGVPGVGILVRDNSANTYSRWLTARGAAQGQTGGNIPAAQTVLSNGSTFDLEQNNTEGTLLASAARTATVASADQTNYNARGVRVFINVTATSATPSITITIQEKDPISGNYIDKLVSAAITTTGQKTTLVMYPGVTAAANVAISEPLGRTWRINATHSDADSITYSVAYGYIL